MAVVKFTENIQRHVACPPCTVSGANVRDVLDSVFAANVRLRGYVLDERGGVRRHMIVFVDGKAILDRATLTDPVGETSEVCVMQALSGG